MSIQQCPTLYPTWKEFNNFYQYVQQVDALYKSTYGMVKVVPPAEWKAKSSNYAQKLQNLTVNGPIEQNIFGKNGVYECLHIQKKSMSYKEYKQKMGVFDKITDGMKTEDIQAMFWKNIVFSPPLYGADLLNTLMDETAGSWNLNCLDSILKHAVDVSVRGVTTSYCYIGSWKALFCWHREDLDLSAINYLHQGKSKFWYCIPSSQSHILQKEAKSLFGEHFAKCGEYLRHKTTLINPYYLQKKYPQLLISKIQHKPRQFMLVLGGSYHCGFNFGVNIAEAINYATLDWLNQLPNSKICRCSKSTVRANLSQILSNLQSSLDIKIGRAKEFMNFKKKVEAQADQQEIDREKFEESKREREQQKMVKLQFSKKIKKSKKPSKKVNINGQEYQIQDWIQCDLCKEWRRTEISNLVKQKQFACRMIGKNCKVADKREFKYIVL